MTTDRSYWKHNQGKYSDSRLLYFGGLGNDQIIDERLSLSGHYAHAWTDCPMANIDKEFFASLT
jgi:hypothetical protein